MVLNAYYILHYIFIEVHVVLKVLLCDLEHLRSSGELGSIMVLSVIVKSVCFTVHVVASESFIGVVLNVWLTLLVDSGCVRFNAFISTILATCSWHLCYPQVGDHHLGQRDQDEQMFEIEDWTIHPFFGVGEWKA